MSATAHTLPSGAPQPAARASSPECRRARDSHDACAAAHRDGGGRSKILGLLRRGAGVTQILDTIAQDGEGFKDAVRRARLLRAILQDISSEALSLEAVKPRKAARTLAYLDSEIAWLEHAAAGRLIPKRAP